MACPPGVTASYWFVCNAFARRRCRPTATAVPRADVLGVVWAGDELACGRLCVSGGSGREALRACPSSGRAQRAGSANSLTRRGVSGRMSGSLARAGNASPTAFATAAGAPTMPASPAPFTPSGLSGTGCSTMTGRIRSGSTSRSAASSIVPRSESTASSPGSRRWCAPRCSGSSRSRRASARGGRMTLSNVLACRISPPSSSGSKSPARVGFHLQREKTDA